MAVFPSALAGDDENVYSMQAFGVSNEEFRLDVWYNDPSTGVDLNHIPRNPLDGTLLIQLLGLDRMDINTMPNPDGVFDYVDNAATEGGTINSQNGRIFFPSVEPFGNNLREEIEARVSDPNLVESLIATSFSTRFMIVRRQQHSKYLLLIDTTFVDSSNHRVVRRLPLTLLMCQRVR